MSFQTARCAFARTCDSCPSVMFGSSILILKSKYEQFTCVLQIRVVEVVVVVLWSFRYPCDGLRYSTNFSK
ncbi:hypothetical protein Y032_0674g1417 [Ancylostoma ceylanicum]|uniref:Uncharacterized protein n=1 Tax=Ancylostoma ceylanicum TaxID=53326 RepID=A0A016WHM9_9BILA|nr:hypothetical protein Y032_0674g1417 [Ancylostoma ceylanicum]